MQEITENFAINQQQVLMVFQMGNSYYATLSTGVNVEITEAQYNSLKG